jgi:hypothetical protein
MRPSVESRNKFDPVYCKAESVGIMIMLVDLGYIPKAWVNLTKFNYVSRGILE